VGHRCIGAKVNRRIVPFTYKLQNGDQVEVLTTKQPQPSRDWMQPGLGYVHSARARATIHSYFKKQDKEKNLFAGKELLERELARANTSTKVPQDACEKFNVSTLDDLYAGIGAGDIRVMTVVNYVLHQFGEPEPKPELPPLRKRTKNGTAQKKAQQSIEVEGVGHLMSQLAKCCQPVPGEPIMGYITQGKGVSVHNENCLQLQHLLQQAPERAIEVNWSQDLQVTFETTVTLRCIDRDGMLRDITTVLANEDVTLLGVQSKSDKAAMRARIQLTVEVKDADTLRKTLSKLQQIQGVMDVQRD
jgi:GTP pyrophosphokinase